MRTRIVCLQAQDDVVKDVKKILRGVRGFAEPETLPFAEAEAHPDRVEADLVVVLMPTPAVRGQELVRRLREKFAGPIVAVGRIDDPKSMLRTLHLGADQFIDEADLASEFEVALRKLLGRGDVKPARGTLLACLSAAGGCGASTVAANVAALLARQYEKCFLLDLKPGGGDLSALLDLKPAFSLADACQNENRLDQAMFEKMLAAHDSGVRLLSSPPRYEEYRGVTVQGVVQAVAHARALFPHSVVDLQDCFHAEQVEVLRQASGVLLVTRLDFSALRNARRVLEQLDKLGVMRARVRVVVNHAGLPGELPVEEAEDAVGEKLTSFVSHDPRVMTAANNAGTPAVLKSPESRVAQQFRDLVQVERPAPKTPSGLVPNLKALFRNVLSGKHQVG